jgi:hypothetical protein
MSDALKQLELRVPSGDAAADGPEQLPDDLRTRVAEAQEAEAGQQVQRNYEFAPPESSSQ